SFVDQARRTLSDEFSLMTALGARATSAIGAGTDTAGSLGSDFRTVGQRFGNWWDQSFARRTVRFFFRRPVGEPGTTGYRELSPLGRYFIESGREILRTTPEGMLRARLG